MIHSTSQRTLTSLLRQGVLSSLCLLPPYGAADLFPWVFYFYNVCSPTYWNFNGIIDKHLPLAHTCLWGNYDFTRSALRVSSIPKGAPYFWRTHNVSLEILQLLRSFFDKFWIVFSLIVPYSGIVILSHMVY